MFRAIPGVLDAVCVYVGGKAPWPTYECIHDYTEGVTVVFDSDVLSIEELLEIFLVKFRFRTAVVALSTCQAFGGTLQIRKILSKPSSAKWRLKLEVILPCIVVEPSTYTEQKNITRDSLKRTANFEKWSVKKSHFDLLYIIYI